MQIPINTLPLAKKKNAFIVFQQLKCLHKFIQTKLEQTFVFTQETIKSYVLVVY